MLTIFIPKNFAQTTLSQTAVQIQKCWENNFTTIKTIYGSDNTNKRNIDNIENFNSLFSFDGEFLRYLDYKTGKERWRTNTGGELAATPILQSDGIIIVTKLIQKNNLGLSNKQLSHTVRFIDKESGITIWTRTFYDSDNLYLYGLKDVTFLINQKGGITALNPKNGDIIWEKTFSKNLNSTPFIFDDKIIFAKDLGFIVVSLSDKKIIFQNNHSKLNSFALNNNLVFGGDNRGVVEVFKIGAEGKSWSYRLGGAVSSVIYQKGFVLVTSLDNFVYYFSADDGNLIWKKRAGGRLFFHPLIFENSVLILADGSPIAFLLDLSNGRVINQLTFSDGTFPVGNPQKFGEIFVFPTQKGAIAYSLGQCP